MANLTISATDAEGKDLGSVLTDKNGYCRVRLATDGNYRIAPPAEGLRVNFKTYYSNPGYVIVTYIRQDQVANFAYSLGVPWAPPE